MRSRQPVLTAALAVLLTAGLAVATAAPAAATTAPPGATPPPGAAAAAEADEQAPPRAAGEEAQQRQLAFSDRPENVRVDVDSSGYVVYGTPVCTGLVWGCTTRILKDNVWSARLNTQAGYRVSWPADWKEGESRELGKLYTVVKDWIAWWWAPAKGVSLGSITRPYATRSLTAAVESKDDAARTATLSGTATPGATITVQSVSVGTVPSSGRWSTTVRNLSSAPTSGSCSRSSTGRCTMRRCSRSRSRSPIGR